MPDVSPQFSPLVGTATAAVQQTCAERAPACRSQMASLTGGRRAGRKNRLGAETGSGLFPGFLMSVLSFSGGGGGGGGGHTQNASLPVKRSEAQQLTRCSMALLLSLWIIIF